MKINLKYIIAIFAILGCINVSMDIKYRRKEFIKSDNYRNIYENPLIEKLTKTTTNQIYRTVNVGLTRSSSNMKSESNFYPFYVCAAGMESADGYLGLYSYRYQQFWGEVIRPIRNKVPEIDSIWQSKPIHIYLYSTIELQKELIEIPISDYYNFELLSLANVKYFISLKQLKHKHLKQLFGPDSIKDNQFIYKNKIQKLISLYRGSFPHKKLYIYENEKAFDRFFFVTGQKSFQNKTSLLNAMSHASLNDLKTNLYSIGNQSTIPQDNDYSIQNLNIQSDWITLDIQTNNDGYLIVTNNYSKFWQCKVNGKMSDIIPAFITFQAIPLKKGIHNIQLFYKPWWSFSSIFN